MPRINNFNNFNLSPKTIMNIFLCEHRTPLDIWEQSIKIFKSFDLPTSVGISPGHHRGLAYQVLLDSDIKESQDLCDELISKFSQEPLIFLVLAPSYQYDPVRRI